MKRDFVITLAIASIFVVSVARVSEYGASLIAQIDIEEPDDAETLEIEPVRIPINLDDYSDKLAIAAQELVNTSLMRSLL